jgi:hypothetical protein
MADYNIARLEHLQSSGIHRIVFMSATRYYVYVMFSYKGVTVTKEKHFDYFDHALTFFTETLSAAGKV